MRWIPIVFLCLLCFNSYSQQRTAIFNLDMKGNPFHLKPRDFSIHVREVKDRALFANSNSSGAEGAGPSTDRIDTMITLNADFSFRLRNVHIGSTYSVSLLYHVSLDTFSSEPFKRTRAIYQEIKINNWTLEYTIRNNDPCSYDLSLMNRICPKCHKHDKVLPISYGAPAPDPNDDKPAPIKSYDVNADITGCDPNWHCERDKLSF